MKTLPLICVTFIGAIVLIFQWNLRIDLEKQVESARPEVVALSRRIHSSRAVSAKETFRPDEMITYLEPFLESEEASMNLPLVHELLDLLASATTEDLKAMIARIEENYPEKSKKRGKPHSNLIWRIKVILDELEPGTVQWAQNQRNVFLSLLKRSPEEALKWLENPSLSPVMRSSFMRIFQKRRMAKEPSKYLKHWKEVQEGRFLDGFFLLEPGGIADLLPVVNLPENTEIRKSLISSVIYSSLLEGTGLARSRAESLGLEAEELIAILEPWEDLGSEETLEWAIDLGGDTPEKTLNLQESFMARFAQKDLERAGEWLRKFEGSPLVRDEMTKRYAMVLSSVDPEATLPWIERIQNAKTRDWVNRNTLITWEFEDPEGFAEWKAR